MGRNGMSCDPEQLSITLEYEVDDLEPYWVARNPDLPGCLADGETPEEAVRNLRVARMLYLDGQNLREILNRESEGDNLAPEDRPCWEQCEYCDDYVCNIHEEHAHDCTCGDIEWWAEKDMFPYVTTVKEYRETMDE